MSEFLSSAELTGLKRWQAQRRAPDPAFATPEQWQSGMEASDRSHRESAAIRAVALQRKRSSKRRAAEQQRVPAWADHALIQAVYLEAQRLSIETGIPHHVDHEYPLCGKLVSGLHVHQNLRPLPAVENMRKHNHFEVT